MSNPLVSVIIISYNHGRYIKKCVESVVNQTYNNIEILSFDNGSRDNCGEILKQLGKRYNFPVYLQKNIGLANTLNYAIKKCAKGKYIAAIAADDYWFLDKIEEQVKFLEKANEKIVVCAGNIILVDENDKPYPKQYMRQNYSLEFDRVLVEEQNIAAPTAMIRKSVFDDVGYYDINLAIEDYDLWLRILNKGYNIIHLNSIFTYYRLHSNNVTLNTELMNKDFIKILNKYKLYPLFKIALNSFYIRRFYSFSKYNKKKALKLIPKFRYGINNKKILKGFLNIIIPNFILKKVTKFDSRLINK